MITLQKGGALSVQLQKPQLTESVTPTILTQTAPYLTKQSPDANRLSLEVVGGSVAWNQMVDPMSWDNALSTHALSSGTTMYQNHKYLLRFVRSVTDSTVTSALWFYQRKNGSAVTQMVAMTLNQTNTAVINCPNTATSDGTSSGSANENVWFYLANNTNITVAEWNIHDLTLMFGTTIADYVYSLEQSTAGSGIAWLQSYGWFTEDYYPYDAGSLLSVKTSAHKTVGKNLSPLATIPLGTGTVTMTLNDPDTKEWCLSVDASNINYQTASSAFTSFTDMNNVTTYKTPYSVYTADGTSFGNTTRPYTGRLYTTFTGTLKTISFMYRSDSWGIYSGGDLTHIQLEEGSTPTSYEAPFEHVYPLSDIELRGIPKLADGQMYYDGDTYESSGSVTRKCGVVTFDGSSDENWSAYAAFDGFLIPVDDLKVAVRSDGVCNMLTDSKSAVSGQKCVFGSA